MLLFSTGTRQGMANTVGLLTQFAHGALFLYSGVQPADADSAVGSSTLLGIVTHNNVAFVVDSAANGINFDTPVLGVLNIKSTESWKSICVAAGTIGWFRLRANPADAGGASTALYRIDGSVAQTGADLNLPVITVAVNTPVTIDVFQITLPSGQ